MTPPIPSRIILDLCAGSGAWSQPYLDAGYDVRRIDLPEDVRLLPYPTRMRVHGILAAPPCTVFSYARNRYVPKEDELRDALSIVDACLRAVLLYRPIWWALENPLNKLRRYLGPPAWKFRQYEYGDPADKVTALWGHFEPPMFLVGPRSKPSTYRTSVPNAHPRDGITPPAFAHAFFLANP